MLLHQVKRTIDRYHLLDKGDRLIVGVSGGLDSMVLLHLLHTFREEFDLTLIVAHVNHGLRPDEAEREADLVRKESERFGLTFEYGQFHVKEYQKVEGVSLQDAARRIRLHFFDALSKKHGANKLALAHHADDQVETILLRLLRGSGLKGLKGMVPMREGRVIRPLLEVWRRDVEFFAGEKNIPYLLDSSNLREDYLRNRIRLNLIPLIEKEYQPNFRGVLFKTSLILREEDAFLDRVAQENFKELIRREAGGLSFRYSEYRSLDAGIQWRILRKTLESLENRTTEVDLSLLYEKLRSSSPSLLLELDQGICMEKRYDLVSFRKGRLKMIPPFEVELRFPGRTMIPEIGREVIVQETERKGGPEDLFVNFHTAVMDYERLQSPLRMRNFRPGDRFQPLGVKGTQKLKEFFIDHKVPRFERERVPLLVAGERVVWVVGHRIDERVKVTEKTRRILKVEVA